MAEKRIAKYYKKKAADRREAELLKIEPALQTLSLEAINWQKGVKVASVAAVVVLIAYMWTLWGGYVYCDYFNLSPLRTITQDWGGFWSNLLADALVHPLSRPLVRGMYATDIAFGTISSAAVFHGDNLCVHLANCIVLFILAFKLTGLHNQQKKRLDLDPYVVAAAASILFACHPLTAESVAYISGRSSLLVSLNYMIAILLFLRGFLATQKQIRDALIGYGFCYIFVAFSIWSGPQGLTAGGAIFFLALVLKPKDAKWLNWLQSRPLEFFANVFVAFVLPFILLLQYKAPIGNGFGLATLPTVAYIATQLKALVTYYLRVVLVPFGLSLDPPMTMATSFADPFVILGALVLVGALYLAWHFRATVLLSFSFLLFVLAQFPDLVLPQPEVIADRRMYLPLLALTIPFGVLVARCAEKRLLATLSVSVMIVLLFLGLTNWRNYAWQRDTRLWNDAYEMNKDSERSRIMRIWAMSKGDLIAAVAEAEKELKRSPDSALLNVVLGKYYSLPKLHKYEKAMTYFETALKLAEKQNINHEEVLWDIQYGMALSLMRLNKIDEAKEYADKASLSQPNNAVLHLVRGSYYLSKDQPPAAFKELQMAHKLDRYNPDILAPLARAAIGCGKPQMQDIAYGAAKRACSIKNSPSLQLLVSYAALEAGRLVEAVEAMHIFESMSDESPEAYYIQYGIYKRLHLDELAERKLKLALELDPDIRKKVRMYLTHPIVLPRGVSLPQLDKDGKPIPPKGAVPAQAQAQPSKANKPGSATAAGKPPGK